MHDRSRHMYMYTYSIMDLMGPRRHENGWVVWQDPQSSRFFFPMVAFKVPPETREFLDNYPLPVIGPLGSRKTDSMISFSPGRKSGSFNVTFEASMWCGAHVRTRRWGSCVNFCCRSGARGGWTSLLLFLMVMEEYEIKARMFDELARNMCFLLGMSSFFHLLYVYE